MLHQGLGGSAALAEARRLLDRVRIPEAGAAADAIRSSSPAACGSG